MIVLGIETSCDETSVGIVKDGNELLACVTASSMEIHAKYGGVVPEIAAREHITAMTPTIESALEQAGLDWSHVDSIAVTYGAGLGGSLLVGVLTARTLAITKNKPLYAVNHVEGHVYANFLTKTSLPDYTMPSKQPEFPLLALIVSGGHSQLALFNNHFDYKLLGQTQDDAIGEAFDKVAKIIGLPYPGGPSIAQTAQNGDANYLKLPKAQMQNKYDFSFSGLKTAVLRAVQAECGKDYSFPSFKLAELLSGSQVANIAASFQKT
ncbi:tRNA (adenosine(37)-N6)-threonylcarbamoyltransferase complex transferase subunit TsaD, partial [Candidatus Saccharibacteria bacterium]|nr:tRNA (adenosine(37)-N6)-threonylcarbamoyltransferase complex transferase subunit TsaD [Candidatus Saccharibacteria bacterium]